MEEPAYLLAEAAWVGRHLLALALLAASAYVAGRWLAWDLAWRGPAERLAVATALGLAALGTLGFLLGLSGQLARRPVAALLLVVHALAWPVWRELAGDLARLRRPAGAAPGRLAPALALGAAALAPLFLLALYPPTAFDATLYHLPFARAFAATGELPWLPHLRFPVFPQLSEVLFAGMMLLAGDVATHLVELLCCLATALLLLAWGSEEISPAAGRLAAAAYLGNPLVVHLGATAYVEPGLALFTTACLFAVRRWRRGGGLGWLALAGVFGAAAASVKYLGLFFLAVGGLAVLAGVRRPEDPAGRRRVGSWRPRQAARALAVYGGVALVALLPWYGRILFYTGNPVFPFLSGIFGESPWQPQRFHGLLGAQPETAVAAWQQSFASRLGHGLARLAALPWDWTFRRAAVGWQPPVSPVYLAALPVLAWAAARDRRLRGPLLVALVWMAVSLALPADVRYLLPALALLSLVLGGALDRAAESLAERRPALAGPVQRRLLAATAVLLFLPGWSYGLYRLTRQGPPPATSAARERYLEEALPLYPAVAALNRIGGERYRAYGLFAENMKYFVRGDLLGDWNGETSFDRIAPLVADPERLYRELRGRGARYLLVHLTPRELGGMRLPDTPAARRRFRLVYADERARVYALR